MGFSHCLPCKKRMTGIDGGSLRSCIQQLNDGNIIAIIIIIIITDICINIFK